MIEKCKYIDVKCEVYYFAFQIAGRGEIGLFITLVPKV